MVIPVKPLMGMLKPKKDDVPLKRRAGFPLKSLAMKAGCTVATGCTASAPLPDWSAQRETLPPFRLTPLSARSHILRPAVGIWLTGGGTGVDVVLFTVIVTAAE